MIVVQYILPSIRAAVSRELVEKHRLKKSHVAKLMGLTPAAVTQYLNSSRGDKMELLLGSQKIMELISEFSQAIVEGVSPLDMLVIQMCRICNVLRSQRLICELHMEEVPQLKLTESCACGFGLVK